MNLDNDELIAAVKKRPALWDPRCPQYSDRLQITKKWEEVIEIFTDPDLSDEDRNYQGKLLRQRWRTVRDTFVKEKRERATYTFNRKPYRYYDQLTFLDPVVGTNPNTWKHLHQQRSDDSNDDSLDMSHDSDIKAPESKKKKIGLEVSNKKDQDDDTVVHQVKREQINENDDVDDESDIQINVPPHEFVNVLKTEIKEKEEEDCDRLFMLSLVSDFKRVPHRLKSMVKMNMLKCIMAAQQAENNHEIEVEFI